MPNNDKYPVVERKYKLDRKIDSTPEVLVVKFKSEDGEQWPFDPGMFMMISGIDAEGKKHIARAFSISSDPTDPELEFLIVKEPRHPKVVAQPVQQPKLATTPAAAAAAQTKPAAPSAPTAPIAAEQATSHFVDAKIGDEFVMRGPNGQFRFDPNKDKKVLFIAGGTGLAPFLSMLRHIKVSGAKPDVRMMYSIKYPTEIILKDELEQLVKDLNVGMTITVTRPQPGDGWTGQTGHIADIMIKQCVIDVPERMCYICGPLAFVKAVREALAHCGCADSRISADVWG